MKPVTFAIVLVAVLAGAGVANAGDIFGARLSGAEEVPPVDTATTGRVIIEFNDDETQAQFQLIVRSGVRVQQSHIHCGAVGVNGPVVVFLAGLHPPGWEVDGEWVSNTTFTNSNIVNDSCGTTLAALAQNIRDGNTYANVHTVANPGGEVRGQLRLLIPR